MYHQKWEQQFNEEVEEEEKEKEERKKEFKLKEEEKRRMSKRGKSFGVSVTPGYKAIVFPIYNWPPSSDTFKCFYCTEGGR